MGWGWGGTTDTIQVLWLHDKWGLFLAGSSRWKHHMITQQVGKSVELAFIALAAIFWLIANILVIFDKKYASRQKRVLFNCFTTKQCLGMLKMWGKRLFCLSLVLYGSLWLPALSHRNTSNHPRGTWFADILAMKTRLWRDDVGVLEDYLYTQVIQIAAMGAPSVKNWLHSCFFRPPAICWI